MEWIFVSLALAILISSIGFFLLISKNREIKKVRIALILTGVSIGTLCAGITGLTVRTLNITTQVNPNF